MGALGLALADHWVWMILGCLLVSAELLAPGYFLMWIGGAALATGLATAFLPLGVALQLGLFGVIAIAAVSVGRHYFADNTPSADPDLNNRAARMIGATGTVVEAIDAGRGRVKIGDSVWNASGADLAIGTKVRITGLDAGTVQIEAIQSA